MLKLRIAGSRTAFSDMQASRPWCRGRRSGHRRGRTGTDRGAGAVTGTGRNRNPGWQTEDGCGGRTEASNQVRAAVQLGQPAQIETEGA
jgi:hypothetical protein